MSRVATPAPSTLAEPRPERRVSVVTRQAHRRWPVASGAALGVVVAVTAAVAIALHRNGHTQGDDFALYLRQARSLFDGDIAQVVADNRFTVINSGGRFSPVAYPWGWPLLLAPFVHLWRLDYERLKLLEVACLCAWLILVHGIVRRRAGRVLALSITAVVGTAPLLLEHTDQLLSEYPHVLAVAAFIWWIDRILVRRPVIDATTRDLVVLGVFAAAAFNVRRESVVLVGVIAVTQFVEAIRSRRDRTGWPSWQSIGTPYLSFVVTVAGFQLLIPSMLLPDNGGGSEYIGARIGDYAGVLTEQLGLGSHPVLGAVILLIALGGMVLTCVRAPRLNVPLVAVAVLSTIAVSTHFRMVERYYFQVLPWVIYFAAAAIIAAVGAMRDERVRRFALAAAVAPLVYLVAAHAVVLPEEVQAARDFNRAGRQQIGPTDPNVTPVFAAVLEHTPPDAIVAFFRARMMTLYTDRRTIQTSDVDRMLRTSDYYAQQRGSEYSQPALTSFEAAELGLEEVWSNGRWVLWKLPEPS